MTNPDRRERSMEAAPVESVPPRVDCGELSGALAANGGVPAGTGSKPADYIAEIVRLKKVLSSKDAAHAQDIGFLEDMVETQMLRSAELEASLESLRSLKTAGSLDITGPLPDRVKVHLPSKPGTGSTSAGSLAGGDVGPQELAEMQAKQHLELVRLIAEVGQREEALQKVHMQKATSHNSEIAKLVEEIAELEENIATLKFRCAELEAALAAQKRSEADRQAEVVALQALISKMALTEEQSANTIQRLEESVMMRETLMLNQDKRAELREQEHTLQLIKLQAAVERLANQAEGCGLEVVIACVKELIGAMKRSERDYHFQRAAAGAAIAKAQKTGDREHVRRIELDVSNAVLQAAERKMQVKDVELTRLVCEAAAAASSAASSRLHSPSRLGVGGGRQQSPDPASLAQSDLLSQAESSLARAGARSQAAGAPAPGRLHSPAPGSPALPGVRSPAVGAPPTREAVRPQAAGPPAPKPSQSPAPLGSPAQASRSLPQEPSTSSMQPSAVEMGSPRTDAPAGSDIRADSLSEQPRLVAMVGSLENSLQLSARGAPPERQPPVLQESAATLPNQPVDGSQPLPLGSVNDPIQRSTDGAVRQREAAGRSETVCQSAAGDEPSTTYLWKIFSPQRHDSPKTRSWSLAQANERKGFSLDAPADGGPGKAATDAGRGRGRSAFHSRSNEGSSTIPATPGSLFRSNASEDGHRVRRSCVGLQGIATSTLPQSSHFVVGQFSSPGSQARQVSSAMSTCSVSTVQSRTQAMKVATPVPAPSQAVPAVPPSVSPLGDSVLLSTSFQLDVIDSFDLGKQPTSLVVCMKPMQEMSAVGSGVLPVPTTPQQQLRGMSARDSSVTSMRTTMSTGRPARSSQTSVVMSPVGVAPMPLLTQAVPQAVSMLAPRASGRSARVEL